MALNTKAALAASFATIFILSSTAALMQGLAGAA